MSRPAEAAGPIAVTVYYGGVAAACTATGYYLPAGLAILMSLVLFLALATMTVLVVMLAAELGGHAEPRASTASIGVRLTAVAAIGGCALGATLR